MSDPDLTDLLAAWPYEPGRIDARQITGRDGREKIQMRLDLGVLQMEVEGRPDGKRPRGFDTALAFQKDRLERYTQQTGSPAGFVLSTIECAELREEAVQFYHRYVALLAIRDHAAVIRDTSHNLEILDLCRDFGESENDRTILEQFRPQVVTMRARSEAEAAIAHNAPKQALAALDGALAELRAMFSERGTAGDFEATNEVQLLRGMRDMLVPKLPASQKAELQERLRLAIEAENYELAAILRDELRLM